MPPSEVPADLTVVILAYGHEHAPGLAARLLAEGVDPGRVLVVQNPRDGDDDALAPSLPPGVRLVRRTRNLGYAAAMNAGLQESVAAGSTRTLLLTQDVDFAPGAVAALAGAAAARARPGITGPRLRWLAEDGTVEREQHGGWWAVDGRLGSIDGTPGPPLDPDGRLRACDHLDGAALLVDHAVLDGAGMLDERFFLYFEETDWCLRAQAAGFPVACAVEAAFSQTSGAPGRPGAFGYLFFRNHLEVARRHGAAGAVWRTLLRDLRELPLRRLVRRRQAPAVRAAARARATGHLLGVLAFLARRSGPPPGWLPGLGDVTVRS